MMTAREFVGLYAIIPTPARPDAGRWDAKDTVDVQETERLVDELITAGAAGIIAVGTTGECPTLSEADFDTAVAAVVSGVGGRVPTFIGATAAGGHATMRRLEKVAGSGATGSLLGLPSWQPLTLDMALDHYAQVSSAFPDLAIMAYANRRAFRFDFSVPFWQGVHELAPTVTSAKVSQAPELERMIEVTEGAISFLPIDMLVHSFAERAPESVTACWATAAAMGPEPSLRVMDAVLAGDQQAIAAAAADIAWANEPVAHLIADQDIFASHNIQIEKERIAASGYCVPGPVRPPYGYLAPEHAAAAQECGRRWSQIRLPAPERALSGDSVSGRTVSGRTVSGAR